MTRNEAQILPLGERIETIRQSQGRTATWLAQQANISTSSYWRLIASPESFRVAHLISIARALDTNLADLVSA